MRLEALRSRFPLSRQRVWALGVFLSVLLPVAVFFAFDFWFPFPYEKLQREHSIIVYDRAHVPLRMFLASDGQWRFPVGLEDVHPALPRALVASEDRWFYYHPGVNPAAILRAAWANLRAGSVVSGASTIPMQVARLAEPRRRTWWAKLVEGFRALQLSLYHSKREVLELYLNLTPYGGNIEGIGAAAYFHFGKTPDQLSLGEIALLTVLPRSPNRYDPVRHPVAAREARNRVLFQLADRDTFASEELDHAMRQELPLRRHHPPFRAPHVTRGVLERADGVFSLSSTIDSTIQSVAERQVRGRIGEIRARGIGNAAVVVLQNKTREVLALVGSAGFFEEAFQGQVNGSVARRSPGSTLKPFLYAMAYEQGLLVPESFVLDIPTNYSGYVAENYDGVYRGRVRAAEALTLSLNASAVRLLARVGLDDFHGLLLSGGLVTLDRPVMEYGLPLVLGAGEVRLVDLTNLYATLAEGGLHRKFRLTPGELPAAERLFSREATHWVGQSLLELKRPDLPDAWDLTRDVPAVAWKTGTSYGHRDAWAIGFSEELTIGVWVGNFDGKPQKGISGATDAGPLLFDLFRAIEKGRARMRRPAGLEVTTIQVCSLSHDLPNPFCPARVLVDTLPGRSRLSECTHHRRVLLDRDDGLLLKGDCVNSRPYRAEIVAVFPAELTAWWMANGQNPPFLPALSSKCNTVLFENPLEIVSPDPSSQYVVRRDAPPGFQKVPLAVRGGRPEASVYWYQDGRLVASGPAASGRFLELAPGVHQVVAVDESGRSDRVTYSVLAN